MLAVMATTAEVAAAMLLLHSAGIVHGDLSAFNVLLSR
jgi:serine/threonine-protein kinase RIO1